MKSVNQDTYFAAHRFGFVHRVGGRVVKRGASPLVGNTVDGGCDRVEVKEFATPGAGIVSRKVTRGADVECWLRRDIADAAEEALAKEEAERVRVIDDVKAYAAATRGAQGQRAETYVLSSALIHAAARRQSTLGRLYDMNSRGDRVRGNLVAALDRAIKAEGTK